MRVAVTLVSEAERETLSGFVRAYLAEMNAIIGSSFEHLPGLEIYWTEPDRRWPYRIEVDGAPAGFVLIRQDAELELYEVDEFFVARPFRRSGVGLAAARQVIGLYPGRWSITQREVNTGAIAFWHRVLDGFIAYDEAITATDAVRREQRFTITPSA